MVVNEREYTMVVNGRSYTVEDYSRHGDSVLIGCIFETCSQKFMAHWVIDEHGEVHMTSADGKYTIISSSLWKTLVKLLNIMSQ